MIQHIQAFLIKLLLGQHNCVEAQSDFQKLVLGSVYILPNVRARQDCNNKRQCEKSGRGFFSKTELLNTTCSMVAMPCSPL